MESTNQSTARRTASKRWRGILSTALFSLWTTGCIKPLLFLGLLIGGPPSIEPGFERDTKKSFTDKDVTVAVICHAPKPIQLQYAKIDRDISVYVAHKLKEKKIKVINPDRVNEWLDKKDEDWDNPEEIGVDFNTKYVVYVEFSDFNLFEEGSVELRRGRSELEITVFEINKDGSSDNIYSKPISSKYPLMAPKPASEVSHELFRRQYLSRLAEEIGRHFYPYFNGDDMPDSM